MSDFLKKQLRSYYEHLGYKVGEIEIKGNEATVTITAPQCLKFILVNVDVDNVRVEEPKRELH